MSSYDSGEDRTVCNCPCHIGMKIGHLTPCCEPCFRCGVNVKSGQMQTHFNEAHPELVQAEEVDFNDVSHVDRGECPV